MFSAEIRNSSADFSGYGVLQVTSGSMKLIIPEFKGTALGGLCFALLAGLYSLIVTLPFLVFHVPPVLQWNQSERTALVIALVAGFIATVLLGLDVVRKLQVRYPKLSEPVSVVKMRLGRFQHELLVRAGNEGFVLQIATFRRGVLEAAAKTRIPFAERDEVMSGPKEHDKPS